MLKVGGVGHFRSFLICEPQFLQMPLFGKSHKSPPDIIRNLREALTTIEKCEKGEKKSEKAVEDVNRWLQAVKLIIYGQDNQEPHTEQVILI